jgi:hypothetical protein
MTTPDQTPASLPPASDIDVQARFEATVAKAAASLPVPPAPQPSYTPTGPQPAQTPAASSSGVPNAGPHTTSLGWLHRDLKTAGSAISHAWPIIMELATNPQLDALVQAGLRAVDAGVAIEVFQAGVDALQSASARAEAAQAPAPPAAADQAVSAEEATLQSPPAAS